MVFATRCTERNIKHAESTLFFSGIEQGELGESILRFNISKTKANFGGCKRKNPYLTNEVVQSGRRW